jgi:hypothetical protein
MGLLDDAIREHLELKRQHGADPAEVERQEREALGPPAGGQVDAPDLGAPLPAEPPAGAAEPTAAGDDPPAAIAAGDALPEGEPGVPEEPAPGEPASAAGYDEDPWVEEEPAPPGEEDVLEETPEFLQETPEHDRLWFEQKPPRDFDWDR